jgi:hypothetical protein
MKPQDHVNKTIAPVSASTALKQPERRVELITKSPEYSAG